MVVIYLVNNDNAAVLVYMCDVGGWRKPLTVNFNDYLLASGREVTVGSNKLHYYSATLAQAILLNIHHVSGHIIYNRLYITDIHAPQVANGMLDVCWNEYLCCPKF